MTVFAVAHNFFEQDRRIVAIDRDGKAHPAVRYSAGSDGDKKWVIDIIDAEFPLPPDQIKEYQVQFRPFELAEIKDIALNPRPTGEPAAKTEGPHPENRPATASSALDPNKQVSDQFTKFAKVKNPEVKEHHSITISRAYWADADDAPDSVKRARRTGIFHNDGSGQLLIHGEEWIDGEPWQQYKVFLLAAGKEFVFQCRRPPGCPWADPRRARSSVEPTTS